MITTIASAYAAAADHGQAEPHLAWRLAWQRLKDDWQCGQSPALQDLPKYLAEVPPEDQRAAALDLIAEHLHLAWQAGCSLTLDDYIGSPALEWPWLAEPAAVPADFVEDELIARSTPPHGDQPTLAHYAARFPNRPDIMRRLAGRCLGEQRYVKLRVLGVGLLGVVHQAYDRVGQRLVAIKAAPRISSSDDSPALLLQEARITADLEHPSIVTVYDVGQTGDSDFYVMTLVEGRTLAEQIQEYHGGRMSRSGGENLRLLQELITCVAQICEAIAHAHERSILHRDIKPGNVIVNRTGHATIIDWGMARRLAPGVPSQASNIVGTPQYMAPEQADGREVAASDVFSLGAMLYEVLAGRPPYDWAAGALPGDWQAKVREAAVGTSIRQVQAAQALKAIVGKALAKSPSERQASAAELAGELRQYLASLTKRRSWLAWLCSRP